MTVVTPAYNAAAEIERVVRSVAAQTQAVLEHIVVDDGSTDQTSSKLKQLQSEFDHLVVANQDHQGAAAARNHGIRLARGRYIAFLDSDDEWLPDKLLRQIEFMVRTETAFSYGDYLRCDGDSRLTIGAVCGPDELNYDDFLRGCPIGCLTAAYDQHALGKVFMPDVRRGHDWGLWLALTRDGAVARRFPGVEAVYSVGRRSLSGAKLRKTADIYRIYRQQEGLGRRRSLRLLFRHVLNSLRGYRYGV